MFQKDFDTLFAGLLTDWQNQSPQDDLSPGSLIFIKNACLASALWGLYNYQDWISRQIFPDTADAAYLERHAWVRGLSRTQSETDTAYLARVLDDIRRPPAGGNQYDYVKWALQVTGVAKAYCVPLGQGLGTVDVIIVADANATGDEIPSNSARIGVTTSASTGELVDTAATFETGHAVAEGDIVENPIRKMRTNVTSVDSETALTLADDIFLFAGEPYIIYCQTGTNTSVSAGKLVDSGGIFTHATYTVKPGDPVECVEDGTETRIVTVDSGTVLSLADDIFTDTGKTYVIRPLVAETKSHIDQYRPVTASKVSVLPPTQITEDVTMTVIGLGLDRAAIAADITAYMNTMIPGQTLYLAKLTQIAMAAGAENVIFSAPAADVAATTYEIIRPGVISVT